jgi:hypothetical protein
MRAELIGRATLPTRIAGRTTSGWWAQDGTELLLLDPALATIARVPIGTQWIAGHAIAGDLGAVAISDQEAVRVLAADGSPLWSFAHTPWGTEYSFRGSCSFTADGRWVLATMPETDVLSEEHGAAGPFEEGEESDDDFGDRWCVFDARTGEVVRWWVLGVEATGSMHFPHPSGAVMLDVAEGQDGAHTFIGDPVAGLVAFPGVDRALVGLHPAGTRFLSAPLDGTGLVIHRYPDGSPLVEGPHRPGGEWYVPYGGYLNDEQILSATVASGGSSQRHVIQAADDLRLLDEVEYPADHTPPMGATLEVRPDGSWVTASGTDLCAWRLA